MSPISAFSYLGYGYTTEYPISRFYVDARIQTIYGGTSEIMRELVARSIWVANNPKSGLHPTIKRADG